MSDKEVRRLAQIVCEWDEKDKGRCRCAKATDLPTDRWCKGCTGVAAAVIGAGYQRQDT